MNAENRIIFSHSQVNERLSQKGSAYQGRERLLISEAGRLVVPTGPNEITWSYGLNTVSYPTYGGEVVQILSAFIEDIQVGGDLVNYHMMEDIYLWFATYMILATQGPNDAEQKGVDKFNEEAVIMWYPEREWQFRIKPKALPQFKIGRDIVAPSWQMQAAVVEADPEPEEWTKLGALQGLETISAGIGYRESNPFSAPNARGFSYGSVSGELDELVKNYGEIQDAFTQGDMSFFQPQVSGPTDKSGSDEKDSKPDK